jgi:dTDP-4-amino-4,6-dideoxygalactose transaminase
VTAPGAVLTEDRPRDPAVLAIHGGSPLRATPMPPRLAMGPGERAMIDEALAHYAAQGLDPGYQGVFEERYCTAFAEMMGGGYADAVATGTAALFVALAALELPKASEVIVSPITDPGTISAIILNGLTPKLADSAPGSYNAGPEQIEARIGPRTACVLVVHSVGRAAEIDEITRLARARGLRVLEDCSQAHGALHQGARVGSFGDIAAFSTMYRKASITGASGGVVYSRDQDLYRRALAHADRGKPRWIEGFDDRDPAQFLFPALNLHTDELSCAVGLASLRRLDDTRARRLAFVAEVTRLIAERSAACRPYGCSTDDSPFIYPVFVDGRRLGVDKEAFARAVQAEGIGLSPHYRYLVADWPWVRQHLADDFDCPNARVVRDGSFNLYLNEQYGPQEALDTADAIAKVEAGLT